MAYLGTYKIDQYVVIPATCHRFSSGAAYAPSAITYSIYEEETDVGLDEDVDMTPASPFDSVVGFYLSRRQLTAAAGFGIGTYTVLVKATVDGVAGVTAHTFRIEADAPNASVTYWGANTIAAMGLAPIDVGTAVGVDASGMWVTLRAGLSTYDDNWCAGQRLVITSAGVADEYPQERLIATFDAAGAAEGDCRVTLDRALFPVPSGTVTYALWANPGANTVMWNSQVVPTATAGEPRVDVRAWLGTAAATPTVAGVPEVDVTHWLGTACSTPTTAGVPEVDVTLIDGAATSTGLASAADIAEAARDVARAGAAAGSVGEGINEILTDTGTTIPGTITTLQGNVTSILGDTGTDGVVVASASKSGIRKNTELAAFMFRMTDDTNHAPATGLTVTATRSIDGAAFGACANAVAEVSNGWYKITLAAADLNGTVIALRFTAADADDGGFTIVTQV